MNDQRNLFVAIAISVAILIGWQYFFPTAKPPVEQAAQQQAAEVKASAPANVPSPATASSPAQVPGTPAAAAQTGASRNEALGKSRRIAIQTPSMHGSIALTGARIDDITLVKYRETPAADSAEIDLMSPAESPEPYWAEFGWVATDANVKVPGPESVWQAQGTGPLTQASPVVLTWDNGEGLRFVRTYTVDENYMFGVTQRVENYGTKAASLHPYALLARTGTPHVAGMYILHEGPLGVFDGTLKEMKYDDLKKEGSARYKTTGGWAGITDKYWLTALVPPAKTEITGRFVHQRLGNADRYQVDYLAPARVIEAGKTEEAGFHLFTGAKQVSLLDGYGEKFGIDRFDLAIDFGWFYFLTKPFFYLLQMLHSALGNMGLAILALTVILKLAMFPLANKSYVAMGKMKKLQPKVQELQARYADDKMRLQQEMMALYKAEKVNPVSGCLPIMVQIPVFFALYKVLFVTIEMRHAPFYGWISDLSAQDPTNIFTLFGLIPWTPPHIMHLGVWPLIMGITMYLQQKLNPQPTDPVQAKMMQFLPLIFTFLLANFASGLVIYWAWSNTLSILQQWVIMKRAEEK
ncbi:Inner membrane protein translocase component YidC long form [Paramagnetospirillum magnetotacticum MS-1]|uniref:Membrane protein insertase YidC n=1 Tax=Paramagnetospirillum magnetotacticum MS-1 TaxID=272627 RepID=A0A0C2YSC7_PARME|nr:membrane protein insertase YidC [Paramagnetospirillum magnetotacticum]KIL98043.1 Inner membrane protein translocase component YidC long form [Paramagnetospirillum magnetotacticum MS-1]